MSRADLAHAIRKSTELKASERGVRGWERDEYAPSAAAVAAIAQATGRDIEFFYANGDEQEAALPGDTFRERDGAGAGASRSRAGAKGAGEAGELAA